MQLPSSFIVHATFYAAHENTVVIIVASRPGSLFFLFNTYYNAPSASTCLGCIVIDPSRQPDRFLGLRWRCCCGRSTNACSDTCAFAPPRRRCHRRCCCNHVRHHGCCGKQCRCTTCCEHDRSLFIPCAFDSKMCVQSCRRTEIDIAEVSRTRTVRSDLALPLEQAISYIPHGTSDVYAPISLNLENSP